MTMINIPNMKKGSTISFEKQIKFMPYLRYVLPFFITSEAFIRFGTNN